MQMTDPRTEFSGMLVVVSVLQDKTPLTPTHWVHLERKESRLVFTIDPIIVLIKMEVGVWNMIKNFRSLIYASYKNGSLVHTFVYN